MAFFDNLLFIGKEIIVQTLDTFSNALYRRWTILEIPTLSELILLFYLMNHMSKLLLSAFGAHNMRKYRVYLLFECS